MYSNRNKRQYSLNSNVTNVRYGNTRQSNSNRNRLNQRNNSNLKNYNSKNSNNEFLSVLKKFPTFRNPLNNYSFPFVLLILLCRFVIGLIFCIFWLVKEFVKVVFSFCKKSKVFSGIVAFCIVISVIFFVDFIMFYGKIHPGVAFGEVDLSGKTLEEASNLIYTTYQPRLNGNSVTVYSAEDFIGQENQDNGLTEQLSAEQAKTASQNWTIEADKLEAEIPVDDVVNEAFYITRGMSNFFNRITGYKINPYAVYSSVALDEQITMINEAIGKATVNPSVDIEGYKAIAKSGEDGVALHDEEFISQLDKSFLECEKNKGCFAPVLHDDPQKISFDVAKNMANKVNNLLSQTLKLTYKDSTWIVEKSYLCSWIDIVLEDINSTNTDFIVSSQDNNEENYCLVVKLDSGKVVPDILSNVKTQSSSDSIYNISFEKVDNDQIMVKSDTDIDVPAANKAVDLISNQWLQNTIVGNDTPDIGSDESIKTIEVNIDSMKIPQSLNVDEALSMGVITEISSFTTSFTSGNDSANRNHNIFLAASMLNNSICKAKGGKWSFNSLIGTCSEERGFKEAGIVIGEQYSKGVGGGICQVATTVFNAVYNAGYKIPVRHNHNLHIASYPAGRDAAIDIPSLDLVWTNGENSDVLLQTSTNSHSVTCKLLGINPNYIVKSDVGDWVQGDHYKTENVIDPEAKPNSKYKQSAGSDGKSIVVKRSVYNKDEKLIRTDEFSSKYDAKKEIFVYGPGAEADKLMAEGNARMKNSNDKW